MVYGYRTPDTTIGQENDIDAAEEELQCKTKDEFESWLNEQIQQKEGLKPLFQFFNTDDPGYLTMIQFREILAEVYPTQSERIIYKFDDVNVIDLANRSGTMDFDKFCKIIMTSLNDDDVDIIDLTKNLQRETEENKKRIFSRDVPQPVIKWDTVHWGLCRQLPVPTKLASYGPSQDHTSYQTF